MEIRLKYGCNPNQRVARLTSERPDGPLTVVHGAPSYINVLDGLRGWQLVRDMKNATNKPSAASYKHVSPAGAIKEDTPAGQYLKSHGVEKREFNSYGSRRGNDQVMTRGTFANIRVRNQLAPDTEGGYTTDFTTGEVSFIYDAAQNYKAEGIPLVVLAGKDYGMGSSRDWAAKGTYLLGVKAVIAESYERIHRSNLVGMGVLPLQFRDDQTADSLGLTGREVFDIEVNDKLKPGQDIQVTATDPDSQETKTFNVTCRIDTPVEVDYYRNGGILHTVLRRLVKE